MSVNFMAKQWKFPYCRNAMYRNPAARPVLNAIAEEVSKQGLSETVTVTQTGCIGLCQYEPIVEVYQTGKEKVTYVKMDSERLRKSSKNTSRAVMSLSVF